MNVECSQGRIAALRAAARPKSHESAELIQRSPTHRTRCGSESRGPRKDL